MDRRVLGKGLEALITPEQTRSETRIELLSPEKIRPNRYQPRTHFSADSLQELIASVQEKGLVQPIVVRKIQDGDYELIAGERRLRAVKALALKEIPAVIKNVSDLELLELSIIENIQRDGLNPLEEANAYEALIKNFGFTQDKISKTVGKNRTTIANMLRLLSLPKQIKAALSSGALSFGHAKAILSLTDASQQIALADKVIKEGLSVRETENYASGSKKHTVKTKHKPGKDQHVRELEEELQRVFGTKVDVFHGKKRGKIQIEYYSLDDLERILLIMRKAAQKQ